MSRVQASGIARFIRIWTRSWLSSLKKLPKLYWLGIGKDDFLYKNNAAYRADLDKKGYKYEFMETPGGHVWTCWRIYLSVFAPKLFQINHDYA